MESQLVLPRPERRSWECGLRAWARLRQHYGGRGTCGAPRKRSRRLADGRWRTIRLGKRTDGRSPRIKDYGEVWPNWDECIRRMGYFPDVPTKPPQKAGVLDPPPTPGEAMVNVEKHFPRSAHARRLSDREYVEDAGWKERQEGATRTKYENRHAIRAESAKIQKTSTGIVQDMVMLWGVRPRFS